MALESELTKIENLEVGNIERIIRDIADNEYDSEINDEKIERKINRDFAVYSEMIKEKLPKIINNISLMADVILKLYEIREDDDSYKLDKDYYFTLHKKQIEKKKRIFLKETYIAPHIKIYMHNNCRLEVDFNEKNIVDKIKLFSHEHRLFFCEKNSIDFTKLYLDKIKDSEDEDLKKLFLLPQLLNQVPNAISRVYKENLEKVITKKKKISSQLSENNKNIKSLEVSDF